MALSAALAVPATAAFAAPAATEDGPDSGHVVISEAYLVGGSSGQPYRNKFVELYNPTDEPVSVDGWSVQYKSATGSSFSGVTALSGTIAAGGHYLVQGASNAANGEPLPTPDAVGSLNPSGTAGVVALASQATAVTPAKGAVPVEGATGVVDLLGYGTADTFETAQGPAGQGTRVVGSLERTGDTGDNSADFVFTAEVTPTGGEGSEPEPSPTPSEPAEPGEVTPIAEIQGTGDASPLAGATVTTRGVVTAVYATGGFDGLYLQTAGTGGGEDSTPGASDGVFVFSAAAAADLSAGDHVEVTGAVSEYNGLTELTPSSGGWTVLDEPATVEPTATAWPATAADREALEGMLLAPQGDFTVTDNYDTNYYGSMGLAAGDSPLVQPTTAGRPGSAEYDAQIADNAARAVLLDDGSSTNYSSNANKAQPLPWLTGGDPVRVGAAVTFTRPVVLDYRYDAWGFQPTSQLTPDVADAVQPATFENTREDAPAEVGGDLKVATFNVLNYFSTTGDELTGCTYYTDRDGDPVTVRGGCDARGAAEEEDLQRQQVKIVAAISALDADVVALLEIENTAAFGGSRDQALSDLVDALNAAEGAGTWAYAASPAEVPSAEDVIRNAFIYRTAAAEPVGDSTILVGDEAFQNARQPLAQTFQPADGATDAGDDVVVIANHFKSKGSAGPWPGDPDQGDGQGSSNESRTRQATALVSFAEAQAAAAGTENVVLVGDFNAYEQEDPIKVLTDAGYADLGAATGEYSYNFGGMVGSLDHVLASPAAAKLVTGTDIWNINAYEPIANEYSRHNYNASILYDESPFRSSDHDPVLVGLDLGGTTTEPGSVDLDLVAINDFHGRIDENTVSFAGTVEELRAQNAKGTAFISAGDNIGASLFASALQQDRPTLDVLNALSLKTSAVGNHEFDQGMADLTGRVTDAADWDYLGANVYDEATGEPALPEYQVVPVGGVDVGFVGVVTQETPTLVTPSGIEGLEFGDPVEALNRVTDELLDGDAANGEADVIVAMAHDGAGAGTPDGATLEEEVAAGGPFAELVQDTDPRVAAIFTGHTHKQYAWDAPVPGAEGQTRPIIQTGNYGEFLGHVSLTVDTESFDVTDYSVENVARTATPADELIATYPAVAEVDAIVSTALAEAEEIGAQPIGKVTADVTTAFSGGSYTDGVYTGGERGDRASESALGSLVADSLRDSLASDERGGADIGVVNPGGLRNELYFAGSAAGSAAGEDGVITYAEANAVLPFVNNLWTITLTGAQLDTLLEQQWQTDANGDRPSRPFLALGLSDNVSYTVDTADVNATPGENVSSITIDDVPVDPAAEYRIATFSFLISGGDNFRVFTEGTDGRDSGLVDREAWIDYLEKASPITPSFARTRTVTETLPGTVEAGASTDVSLSGLDLTSLGAPQNTAVETFLVPAGSAAADGVSLGTGTVSDGATSASVTVPADTVPGAYQLLVQASPSGTTARLPLTVEEAAPQEPEAPAWQPWKLYWWGDTVSYRGEVYVASRPTILQIPGAWWHSPWKLVK
ncbi:5'-nucleotidase [Promicromonospora umidemergens]|uniref:ExeM/NucH family extracellular endonuclease n=1 Tax=Promicromonospora umidemergens TaxID=629679 RepID=A0ABP8XFK4_9MICO|nr:ExeM/NucH family extracellular endonuclease [Promicromonospora umidemergens]MCP2284832.1 5'-nucleotidase [Promicromonospora umidemergens]